MAISAVINTYNATEHLERVFDNLRGFDEIVVCDMESTDGTPELAGRLGARVVTFPKGDYNYCEPARMTAIYAARSQWVLVVDADELVTPELRDYLYDFIKDPGSVKGIFIPRKNHILSRFDPSSYPDYQLRFFDKSCVNWPPTIHAVPIIKGKVLRIPPARKELALIHLPHNLTTQVTRTNTYSNAQVSRTVSRPVSLIELWGKPWVCFLKNYILKGAWTMGVAGYITARNKAYYKFLTLAKMHERHVMPEFHDRYRSDGSHKPAGGKSQRKQDIREH
ncbi:MAG: glycosyltransferase family 2 protein [Muribaculaceae bacterium]|nr:glycosyltransferase family 2 protein [Muribaculaceae bacterium]